MESCARCGHELGVGRFCLNCGHPVGQPVPADEARPDAPFDSPSADQARNDAQGEPSSRMPGWLPPALAAVLVAVLLVVLVSCLGGDDPEVEPESRATSEPTTNTVDTGEPKEKQRPVPLTGTVKVKAPPAAPATQDLDGQLADYDADNMLDGIAATTWRTPGDATGETITFTLPEPATIRRVGIVNGFAKQVPSGTGLVDWYPHNRRITAVEWVFDDGSSVRQDLQEKPRLQRLTIDPVTTSSIKLRLLDVTEPGPGVLGRDYTAISDVLIAGTPAS